MLSIKFSLFALLVLGSVLSVSSGCLPLVCNRKSAFSRANALLLDSTKSDDLLDNIQAVTKILQRGNDECIEDILIAFLALKPIASKGRDGGFVCTFEDMKSIRNMKELMEKHVKNPYSEPASNRRLNKLIIGIQEDFGKACLKQFFKLFKEAKEKLYEERTNVISKLPILMRFGQTNKNLESNMKIIEDVAEGEYKVDFNKISVLGRYVFADTQTELSKTWTLSTHNPKTGVFEITRSRLTKLYDELITNSCDYVFDPKELAKTMERTLELARSVKLTSAMQPDLFQHTDMGAFVAGYAVCKELKNVDKADLIDIIGKGSAEVEGSQYKKE